MPIIPGEVPGETWYLATVVYDFTFEIEPDVTLASSVGSRAQFTVRDADGGDTERWQLVEWRYLGTKPPSAMSASGVEHVTWGEIKGVYQ